MKKIAIVVMILLILISVILLLKKHTNVSIKLPVTDCEKVEILTLPISEDYNDHQILSGKRDIDEYINFCNNIGVKKTNDYFLESPNVDIRFHYKNGECYQLKCNSHSSSGLLSISKIRFTDNGIQTIKEAAFFYTDEINELITYYPSMSGG